MPDVYENRNRKVGQWRRFQGTGKRIIIPAPERQKKPAAFLVREKQDFDEKKEGEKNCPFCANKLNGGLLRGKNPEELKGALVEDEANGTKWLGEYNPELLESVKNKKWKTCIIKNINPVLRVTYAADFKQEEELPYIFAGGLGICDIIIESQVHSKPLGVLDEDVCKNVIQTYLCRFKDLQDPYLFSWGSIPGDDNEKLLRFLKDDLDIDWAENAEIRKCNDDMIINISKDENSAEIMIAEKKKKATLKISDNRIHELTVKEVEGKLSICRYPSLKYISIFHNHRREAGATIPHSHSQIFATPFVPTHIEKEIEQAKFYFEDVDLDNCPFCTMIKTELKEKRRVIIENASFIAIAPFASGSPFEIWVLPKEHNPSFNGIREDEIGELADILTWVLGRLYICVDDPGYNFVISTLPSEFIAQAHYWHWHIRIETQGLVIPAGYEMASQVRINPLPPENAAKFLRDDDLGNLFKPGTGSIFQRKPEDVENVLSTIKREVDEETLKLRNEQQNILKIAAGAFMFSEYYIKRKDLYDKNELTEEKKTILNRAMSWASQ